VHAQRFMGLALNVMIATLVAAILTAMIFKISFLYSVIGWFVAGEILHYAFGVNTAFLKMLGITPCKS
jgi:hypothetical protein